MNNDTYDNNKYEHETFEENDFEEVGEFEDPQQEEAEREASSQLSRRKKKPRVKKKRRKKYYTLKFFVLIVICVILYFVAHSAAFTVENITLEKNNVFSLKRVQELTGLKTGVNLFEVDLKEAEKKMEERPYVESAEITRKLPDTINVSLELREPSTVVIKKGKYILLDKNGIVLEITKKLPHYTFLQNLTVEEAKLGQPVKIKEQKKYDEYVALVKKVDEADMFFRKIVITDNEIKLYMKKNLYCVGTKDNIMAGLEDGNLKAVIYTISKKGIEKGVLKVGDDQYYSFSKTLK